MEKCFNFAAHIWDADGSSATEQKKEYNKIVI